MDRRPVIEQLKNAVERIVSCRYERAIRRGARAKRRARIGALATVRHTLHGAAQLNAGNTKTIFNVGMPYCWTRISPTSRTILCVQSAIVGARSFAKSRAVLLYEAAEDLPQLLGPEFRDAIKALGASPEQLSRANAVSSELSRFWHSNREFLGTIRNALAAHGDHDTLRYAEALEVLKPLEVMAGAAGVVTTARSIGAGRRRNWLP